MTVIHELTTIQLFQSFAARRALLQGTGREDRKKLAARFRFDENCVVGLRLAYPAGDRSPANILYMKLQIDVSLTARHLGKPKPGISTARIIRDGKPVVAGICLHDTAGSGTHNDTKYLENPSDGRNVSVDFTVERDGSVYQLNPDLKRYFTYHAGRATKFKAADGRTYRNADCNRVLIGIELVQKARMDLAPQWPTEQVQAAAELCVFLCQTFKIGKESITTHAKIITDGSRIDPRGFPFENFWFEFNRAANVPAFIEPRADALGSPVFHTVGAGDTLSKLATRYGVSIESIKALNGINEASTLIRLGQTLTIRR